MTPVLLYKIFASIFGALVGSFANVLIYRIPLKMSFAVDRSRCPSCDKTIPWYENIPVFGYIFLRGRCSTCQYKIPVHYFFIELLLAIAAYFLFPENLTPITLANFIFKFTILVALTVHFVIDVKHQILPDGINAYLALAFFIYSFVNNSWGYWFFGGLVGFLFPLGVTYLFYLIKKQVGLGGGDIKLFGVLGLILGPVGVMHNIFLSCLLGSLVMLPLMIFKLVSRNSKIPFGPFIIIVAVLQIYFPSLYRSIFNLLF